MQKNNEYIKRESRATIDYIEEKLRDIKSEFNRDNIDYNYIDLTCKIIKGELNLLFNLSNFDNLTLILK